MTPLTPAERMVIRSRIATALCNLGAFRLFWVPAHRAICARSLSVQRAFRVPPGALEIGVYEGGSVRARDILGDIEERICNGNF